MMFIARVGTWWLQTEEQKLEIYICGAVAAFGLEAY